MKDLPLSVYDFFAYLASGLLLLIGLDWTLGMAPLFGRELNIFVTAAGVLVAYIAGQILAVPSKALLEDLLVGRVLLRPSVTLFLSHDLQPPEGWRLPLSRRQRKVLGVLRMLFPGYYRPLPADARLRILEAAGPPGELGEPLFLRVRFSRAICDDERAMARLQTFLALYGFARNICLTAGILAVLILATARYTHRLNAPAYAAAAALVAVGFLFRYLKFFRQYSYEMFNTFGRR